jgi:hypothetical protein
MSRRLPLVTAFVLLAIIGYMGWMVTHQRVKERSIVIITQQNQDPLLTQTR